MKSTPFLDFHNRLMEGKTFGNFNGPIIEHPGLCSALTTVHWKGATYIRRPVSGYEAFDYFIDRVGPNAYLEPVYEYGPLRQTVVLLCAAINGELD